MKIFLNAITAFVCSMIFFYSSISFIVNKLNPVAWDEGARFAMIMLSCAVTLGITVLSAVIESDKKNQ